MILIMGGAGYIGSHTLRHLLDCGYECAVADNLVYGHREAVDPRAAFEKADLLDKDSLRNVFQKFRRLFILRLSPMSARVCGIRGNIIATTWRER